jgi:hypothetical protein
MDDASMSILNDIGGVRVLNLEYSHVSDAGMEYLKGFAQLQRLELGVNDTDARLENLEGLIKLKSLNFEVDPVVQTTVYDQRLAARETHTKGLARLLIDQ